MYTSLDMKEEMYENGRMSSGMDFNEELLRTLDTKQRSTYDIDGVKKEVSILIIRMIFNQWISFIINFIWVVLGIAVLTDRILPNVNLEKPSCIQTSPQGDEMFFLAFVAIIFVIALIGCCDAVRECHRMVVTYDAFRTVAFLVQVVLVIWIFFRMLDPKNYDGPVPIRGFPKFSRKWLDGSFYVLCLVTFGRKL